MCYCVSTLSEFVLSVVCRVGLEWRAWDSGYVYKLSYKLLQSSPWTGSVSQSVSQCWGLHITVEKVALGGDFHMGSRLLFIDEQKTRRGKWRSGCEYVRGLRQMGGRGGRVSRHRNGGQGKGGWGCWGIALCQHVPKTAATQSCPAGCQACVSCVVSSPVLHHVHWRERRRKKKWAEKGWHGEMVKNGKNGTPLKESNNKKEFPFLQLHKTRENSQNYAIKSSAVSWSITMAAMIFL